MKKKYSLCLWVIFFLSLIWIFSIPVLADIAQLRYNSTPIVINDNAPATPYGGLVYFSGMESQLTGIEVSIYGLTHTYPADLKFLLIAPNGRAMVLMAGAGGGGDVNKINLTFGSSGNAFVDANNSYSQVINDTKVIATGSVWNFSSIKSGKYLPTDNLNTTSMPGYYASQPFIKFDHIDALRLGFYGINPNGYWGLYVADTAGSDVGRIEYGWSLSLNSGNAVSFYDKSFSNRYEVNGYMPFGFLEDVDSIDFKIVRYNNTYEGKVNYSNFINSAMSGQNGASCGEEGVDYVDQSQSLFFEVGSFEKSISIPICKDSESEPHIFPADYSEKIDQQLDSPDLGTSLVRNGNLPSFKLYDAVVQYRNKTRISIPSFGVATPYSSNITVSDGPTSISRVRVELYGINHSYPDDLDILLVSPNGTAIKLMSDALGSQQLSAESANFLFEDTAIYTLNDSATSFVNNISYKPVNYDFNDSFPAPAPNYVNGNDLATFNGTDANGTWQLFVMDDSNGNSGYIAGGWGIEFK